MEEHQRELELRKSWKIVLILMENRAALEFDLYVYTYTNQLDGGQMFFPPEVFLVLRSHR
jgi:hypothetical protein